MIYRHSAFNKLYKIRIYNNVFTRSKLSNYFTKQRENLANNFIHLFGTEVSTKKFIFFPQYLFGKILEIDFDRDKITVSLHFI